MMGDILTYLAIAFASAILFRYLLSYSAAGALSAAGAGICPRRVVKGEANMDQASLAALGALYAAEADNLEQMIAACKERRRFAIAGGNSKEAQRLERLAELHAQRADLLKLAAWMKRYYDKSEAGEGDDAGAG